LQESQIRLESRVKERTNELTERYGQLRSVGEQLVLAHESEQRRIARELHDQIGQDLTALKITLSRAKAANLEEAQKALREAEALTEEVLQTVRNICSTLRPQVLDDLGLVAGLQWHIKTFAARTGIEISFESKSIDEARLSPIVKSTIFRVIQEALTNVSRHADSRTAEVSLAMHNGSVEFSVKDSGKGFDVAGLKKGSTGVSSMRERLSLVQGRFEISSAPGGGTTVKAHIPVPHETVNHSETDRIQNGQIATNQNRSSRRSSSRPQRTQIAAGQ
jgi:signal transduction histidine kinase